MALLASIFLNDVLPIFIVAGIGFALARRLKADVRALSRITFNALSPCLVFHLLVTSDIGVADVARMTMLTGTVVLGIGAVARVVAIPFRLDRPALAGFLLVVMFSNAGNYGLPVVLFAFGRGALAHASIYFVANAVLAFTAGVFLASAGRRSLGDALRGVLRVPAVYAAVAAALVMASGVTVPLPIMRPIELLSSAALPAMLLVLGMQLERGAWPERPGLAVLAVVLTLAVTPLIALGAANLLGLHGAPRQAAILQSAMPSAVLTTILALEFDVAPSFVTACVVLSTLVSPVSITLLIALLT
ncbi:MAG: AEC family transporter [Acidobacteria bacterium]|nr:MAG: AEC family transporter [Acidobacteriota bacterium]